MIHHQAQIDLPLHLAQDITHWRGHKELPQLIENWPNRLVSQARVVASKLLHPKGAEYWNPTPSEGDIRSTRDLIRAGELLKIEVLDHVIMGRNRHTSLRELGYFS